jgi:hypothetical protein
MRAILRVPIYRMINRPSPQPAIATTGRPPRLVATAARRLDWSSRKDSFFHACERGYPDVGQKLHGIKHVVYLNSDIRRGCEECGESFGFDHHNLANSINHYIDQHGYKLITCRC